jgi:hypothetical protein
MHDVSLVEKSGEHKIVDPRRKEHSLALQSFDCGNQVSSRIRLEHKAACSGIERLANHLIGIRDCQDDYLELRIVLHQLASRIQAVEARHSDIHNHDVGFEALGHLHRFAPVRGFATNFPAFVFEKQSTQSPTHNLMIIG